MRRPIPLALLVSLAAGSASQAEDPPTAPTSAGHTSVATLRPSNRVFELRTYYTYPGKAEALHARFRDHTCGLFKKHGMELVGFWTPKDDTKKGALIYLLAFPSREAADTSWKAFRDDPDWKAARDASEKDGKIVEKVESVFLDPTDYSPIK